MQTIKLKDVYNVGGNTQRNCYIKIFTQDSSNTWHLVANSPEYQSEIIQNSSNTSVYDHTWVVKSLDGSDFIILPNKEYHLTFNDNNNVDSYSNGYSLRLGVYQSNVENNYLLSDLNHKDTKYNANVDYICELMEEQVVKTETGIEEKMPTELYGEYLDNHHDISYKYSNTNDIISYDNGTVTYTDGKKRYYDIQTAMIGNYAFR